MNRCKFFLQFMFILLMSSASAQNGMLAFIYDDAGNRITRHVIYMPYSAPISDPDSLLQNHQNTVLRDSLNDINISIFPNPSYGIVSVVIDNSSNSQQTEMKLFNANGSEIRHYLFDKNSISLNISDEPDGLYLLRIISSSGYSEWKIIKNKLNNY